MKEVGTRTVLDPGQTSLSSWRAIYRGTAAALEPACYVAIAQAVAAVDSVVARGEPTSANQEDHVSMSAHAARRLLPMVDNAAAVIGIELLAAAQGCDFHAPLVSSQPLERVRALLRAEVSRLEEDRFFAPDIDRATALVRSGMLADAVQDAIVLPNVAV